MENLEFELHNLLQKTREEPGLSLVTIASLIVNTMESEEIEILIKNINALK